MKWLVGQEIVVQKNGVQMSMSQGEAMLAAVFGKAMKGDIACVKFVHGEIGIDLGSKNGAASSMPITDEDLACLKSHADWLATIESAEAELESLEEDTEDVHAPE